MPIERYPTTLPTIYDKFQCKGGKCRNTCCQGWVITVSRNEYNKLNHQIHSEKIKGFLKRLPKKNASDFIYATVCLDGDGLCPFLTKEHMCGMQIDYGFHMLPTICKQFPRLLSSYRENGMIQRFLSLDTGCERVLELLWEESKNGLQFKQDIRESTLTANSILSEHFLYDFASDIRNLCIWLLQNRSYSLSDRMIILGLALRELQKLQDNNASDQIPAWFMKWQNYTKGNDFSQPLSELEGNRQWFVMNNIKTLLALVISTSGMKELLSLASKNISFEYESNLYYNPEQYDILSDKFHETFPEIDNFFENYLIMTMFRLTFPLNETSIWKSYIYLSSFYSFIRFISVICAPKTAETLIDQLTTLSRSSINFASFSELTSEQMSHYSSNTLAHLAILLRG